jgi:ribulose 1,5-bisphosphate synthetase/thiazole synthase
MNEADVVAAGAGHNSLIAAAYLAARVPLADLGVDPGGFMT